MAQKLIAIEERQGPFQHIFHRVMRMVPDRDKNDKNLQRLIAFRLKQDGEAATSEYLIRKAREIIQCGYRGSLYDYLRNDRIQKTCLEKNPEKTPDPPGVA